jgi:hypothetical protein
MDWSLITRIPLKADLYARETYFREASSDALNAFQQATFAILHDTALVLIKPDGLAARKTGALVDYLGCHGFSVVALENITLTGFMWRELWRYQLTAATLDRLAVNDLLFRGGSLVLLLRQDAGASIPASVRLSGLKGPADPALQRDHCLRRYLRQPNRLFNFIHVADEPADVLRELGILLDSGARRRVLESIHDGRLSLTQQQTLDEASKHEAGCGRTFDANESLQRVHDVLTRRQDAPRAAREHALAALAQMRAGRRIEWRSFAEALASCDLALDPWDVLTLGACFIHYDEDGEPKLIAAVDSELWKTRSDGRSSE